MPFNISGEILDALKASGAVAEKEIMTNVTGNNALKKEALRGLLGAGVVAREGSGKSSDCYLYSYSPIDGPGGSV